MRANAALQDLDFDLVTEDGAPVEKTVHLLAMVLFRHLARLRLGELGPDFYVGANQFVYYSVEQARAVAEEERQQVLFEEHRRPEKPEKTAFRGPDAFVVKGVSPHERDAWVAWNEDGRLPDLVLELLSPSTARADRGKKRRIYQDQFKSSEYVVYEPRAESVEGFRLLDHNYQPIASSSEGRVWSRVLEVELGIWHGVYEDHGGPWLRLFRPDGSLVLTVEEQERQAKERERQAKERERQAKEAALERAEAAELENARLRALLAKLQEGKGNS
jgi:Uma2 family endonuclease